jgi:hypothetical protein
MSLSESDLRAALRAGESGARLDLDSVIAQARAARRTRRHNVAAITGAVIAVLAVAGVVTAVQVNRHSGTPVGAPNSTTQSAAACPDNAPTMPHGSGAAPLFPQDVTSINVCAYTLERLTGSKLLTGTVAEKYARRFNALPLRDSGLVACPQFVTQIRLAMLPVTPDRVAPTVVGQIGGCGNTSNGVTSRRAGQLLNELAEGIVTSPIPTVPNHAMSHGPGPS